MLDIFQITIDITNQLVKKRLGDHILKKWIIVKRKLNPSVIVTIDDGKIREELMKKIFKNCKNVILKKAYVSKTTLNKIKKRNGILIQDFAKIMSNVKIGNGTKINLGAPIPPDNIIGKYVTIAPKAVLLGNVKVSDYSYIGANSTIKQKVKIGKGAIVGAGSVVVKDVRSNDVVAGVPAKSIKN